MRGGLFGVPQSDVGQMRAEGRWLIEREWSCGALCRVAVGRAAPEMSGFCYYYCTVLGGESQGRVGGSELASKCEEPRFEPRLVRDGSFVPDAYPLPSPPHKGEGAGRIITGRLGVRRRFVEPRLLRPAMPSPAFLLGAEFGAASS